VTATREHARADRARRIAKLRATDDLGTYADAVFAAAPTATLAVSALTRGFRADSIEEFSDPEYRAAYSPTTLGRMVRALDGDDALAEDGSYLGTYRLVNHSGRMMIRLDREEAPVTAAAQRKRDYRARLKQRQSASTIDVFGAWLTDHASARTAPELAEDTLAAYEAQRGALSEDDYFACETLIFDLFPDWESD
jgi:hypothetical protein